MMETIKTVAPTETKREGLTKSQCAIVRTPKNSNSERLAEMTNPHLNKSKVCCRCKLKKPSGEFYKNKSTKDGLQKECKVCHSESQKKWQSENREKANEIARRYNNGSRKDYVKKHLQKIKIYLSEYGKEWRAKNKDKCRNYKTDRRGRISKVGGSFTEKDFQDLCNKYGNKCLCCGIYDEKLHADHVVPISKGGSNSIENIQPLCKTCNLQKSTKTIDFR